MLCRLYEVYIEHPAAVSITSYRTSSCNRAATKVYIEHPAAFSSICGERTHKKKEIPEQASVSAALGALDGRALIAP